jgi:hypothetical protein
VHQTQITVVKKTLYVRHRPESTAVVHWHQACRFSRGSLTPGSGTLLDEEWQAAEKLTDEPPSKVVAHAHAMFAARACRECIPPAVLERLG